VHPGDIVRRIAGQAALEVWQRRSELVSAAMRGSLEFKTGQALLMGGPGPVALELESPAGDLRSVAVQRIERAEGIREVEAWIPPRQQFRDLGAGIYYIDLDQITGRELHQLLPTLVEARGLVLDLRGYPRRAGFVLLTHLADEELPMPRPAVPILTLPDQERVRWGEQRSSLPITPPRLTSNIAFIIDGRVVSAAEHFLGTAEAAGIGLLIGEPTAGTNGGINPVELPGGYRVVWTGMRVTKPDGSRHHGIGIHPTIAVSPTLEGTRAGRDEMLERATAEVRARVRGQ
jgi:hypothetical protein